MGPSLTCSKASDQLVHGPLTWTWFSLLFLRRLISTHRYKETLKEHFIATSPYSSCSTVIGSKVMQTCVLVLLFSLDFVFSFFFFFLYLYACPYRLHFSNAASSFYWVHGVYSPL